MWIVDLYYDLGRPEIVVALFSSHAKQRQYVVNKRL